MSRSKRFLVALTGASGAAYGLRLVDCLLQAGEGVDLLLSDPARIVLAMEEDLKLPAHPAQVARLLRQRYAAGEGALRVFGKEEWTAPPASGTHPPRAMVVCPCTMGSLAAIAQGLSRNLLERAADVVLKERQPLILVPRETPFSEIHLENMLRLARMGAVILPANPGFYHRPTEIAGLVDFVVARILDHLGVEQDLIAPWGEPE